MRGASLTLFRVRGIPIRAHWTLLLVIPYLAVVLSVQFAQVATLAGVPRNQLAMPPLAWGILLAVGLFASVAVHEIMHTVLALRFGGSVRAITLMLLGGVSELTRPPRRPRDEALMAGVGPLTSLVLGGLLLLVHRGVAAQPDVRLALFYLGYMNVAIGVFNLVPAFPMDGGRVLRAVMVGPLGAERATHVAASVGRVLAVGMGLVGIWSGRLMLVLVAVFVFAGAGAEEGSLRVRAALDGLRVMDLAPAMAGPRPVIEADATLADALARMREQHRVELVVAEGRGGGPLGIVTARDLVRLGAAQQHTRRLRDVLGELPMSFAVVGADASASAAMAEAAESGSAFLVVMAPPPPEGGGGGQIAALVTPADIEAAVMLRTAERRAVPAAGGKAQRPLPG